MAPVYFIFFFVFKERNSPSSNFFCPRIVNVMDSGHDEKKGKKYTRIHNNIKI